MRRVLFVTIAVLGACGVGARANDLWNLKDLNARGTKVTKAGVDRLKQRLPDIRVGFGPAVK